VEDHEDEAHGWFSAFPGSQIQTAMPVG